MTDPTISLCRLTTEYSLNASVQTSVDDVSRVDKKVGCHSKVCGIDAASIFSLYFCALRFSLEYCA